MLNFLQEQDLIDNSITTIQMTEMRPNVTDSTIR